MIKSDKEAKKGSKTDDECSIALTAPFVVVGTLTVCVILIAMPNLHV